MKVYIITQRWWLDTDCSTQTDADVFRTEKQARDFAKKMIEDFKNCIEGWRIEEEGDTTIIENDNSEWLEVTFEEKELQ